MTDGSEKTREISLGDNFGEVIVRVNGMCVQVHADGRVDLSEHCGQRTSRERPTLPHGLCPRPRNSPASMS